VRIWDSENAQGLFIFEGQGVPAYSSDGKRLVTSASDKTVNVWKLAD
jgi:hypothetical protein